MISSIRNIRDAFTIPATRCLVCQEPRIDQDQFVRKTWGLSDRFAHSVRLACAHSLCDSISPSENINVHTYVNTMSYTGFEWDESKNRRNIHKHGVSFPSASTLFHHPHLVRLDPGDHYGEDRWVAVGWIGPMVGVVVFTERENYQGNKSIRIISARKASTREVELYEQEI